MIESSRHADTGRAAAAGTGRSFAQSHLCAPVCDCEIRPTHDHLHNAHTRALARGNPGLSYVLWSWDVSPGQ